jgi:lactoylglutathione lyase
MAKPIHMMVRVLDEKKSVDFYRKAFGLEIADRFPFDDFTLVYLRGPESEFEVELTINHGRSEAYTHGTGYGHVGVVVPDTNAAHAALVAKGYEPAPVKEFKRGDELLARFFFIQDPDGYKIELLERHGHYR